MESRRAGRWEREWAGGEGSDWQRRLRTREGRSALHVTIIASVNVGVVTAALVAERGVWTVCLV